MIRVLLDIYGIGFFFAFFLYLVKAGVEGRMHEKHGILTVLAIVISAALWFIFLPLLLGDVIRHILLKRAQRVRS